MYFFTNVTNIFDSPIPNYNINARIKFNYDNDTVIIEWDKPIENNSYIKGYQLRNNNNIWRISLLNCIFLNKKIKT